MCIVAVVCIAGTSLRPVLIGLAIAAVVVGGVASWFASTHSDGLEWSIAKVTGKEDVSGSAAELHNNLAELQEKTAFLPGYGFKATEAEPVPAEHGAPESEPWPAVNIGTSVSGIVGGLMTLALACLVGFALKGRSLHRVKGNG